MFYKPNNKIIIVDDNVEDLETLSKEFHSNGIGCKSFEYNISHTPLPENVRIAFFDININPSGGGSENQKFNSVANAIKQYIREDNGPYALIFWTSTPEDVGKLTAYIDRVHKDCPKPFFVTGLGKGDFSQDSQKALSEILNDETLQLLFDFENKAAICATQTINQIYDIIPSIDSWGANDNFKESFEKIFSKISTSTIGFEHAKKNPDRAVYEALIPILNFHICNSKSTHWSPYLTSLSSARKNSDILISPDFKESALNTIFHIDSSEVGFPLDTRGAVIEIDKTEPQFEEKYAIKFETWFTYFLMINDSKRRKKIRNDSKLIAIEISSACDFSQNKKRLNKYLLAVIIDPIAENELKNIPANAINIGTFLLDKEFQIWANLNYVFAVYQDDSRFIKPLFVLKKEIMDMIGNKYANHVSRIGITSF